MPPPSFRHLGMGDAAQGALFESLIKQGADPVIAFYATLAEINEAASHMRDAMPENACAAKIPDDCPHAEASAEMAVRKVFTLIGIDVTDPEKVEEFRADLRFGKTMRKAVDKGLLAVVAMIFVGMAAATWAGIVGKIKGA